MSVQLALYYQNYVGYSSVQTPILNQYMGNYNFNSSMGGTLNNIAEPYYGNWVSIYITTYGWATAGVWQGFYSATSVSHTTATTPPVQTVGAFGLGVQLNSTAGIANAYSYCGINQRVNGLTTGANYLLTIEHQGDSTGGYLEIGDPIGGFSWTLGNISNVPISSSAGTITQMITHTGSAGYAMFLLSYVNDATNTFVITSVSLTEMPNEAPQEYSDLNDGQVLVDLYDDQEIPLSLSVDDFTNAAEKPQSYSKDFDLPNTKRNNQIFTHIFDVTKIADSFYDFNIYAKTKAVLKQNGADIFTGYLKVIEIKDNDGEISYNVNLFSQPISLADTLKDRKFSELDFNELAHTYNKTSIFNSWNDGVGLPLINSLSTDSFAYDASIGVDNTNVLKYPFCDWTGSVALADGSSGNFSNLGYPELDNLEQAFRPFIQIKYLIDKIFFDAGFTYTSLFFNTTDFKKLFMDFNWGAGNSPAAGNEFEAQGSSSDVTIGTLSGLSGTALQLTDGVNTSLPGNYTTGGTVPYSFTITGNSTWFICNYRIYVKALAGITGDVFCRWVVYETSSGNALYSLQSQTVNIPITGGYATYDGSFSINLMNDQSIRPEAYALSTSQFIQPAESLSSTFNTNVYGTQSQTGVNQTSLLQTLRGQLGQWEFIKGLMTMFNLVTMPDPDNPENIIIEPYKDIFGQSKTITPTERDWTYKIDETEQKLTPIDLKKFVKFQYAEDSSDFVFQYYKQVTQSPTYSGLYGSYEINSNGMLGVNGNMVSLLSGEEKIEATPFAATVCRPFRLDQLPDFIVPSVYSGNDNGEYQAYDNLPKILYNNGIIDLAPSGGSYYVPAQFGVSSTNATTFLQFSHLTGIQPTASDSDFNFGTSSLIGITNATPKNLYNEYYSEYFSHLYNPNTRVLTIKIDLDADDINTFQFYDIITIKNRQYRVNKIDYKPNSLSSVELILLD